MLLYANVPGDATIARARVVKRYADGLLGCSTSEPAVCGFSITARAGAELLAALRAHQWGGHEPAHGSRTHSARPFGYDADATHPLADAGTWAWQAWYKRGRLHREDDMPARLSVSARGYERQWYADGKLHRGSDMPAVVTEGADGAWMRLVWHIAGTPHRAGGAPAYVAQTESCEPSMRWIVGGREVRAPRVCGC